MKLYPNRFGRLIMLLGILLLTVPGYSQKYAIKFATLAPEGSTWMNVMQEFDQELRQQTNGEVGFRIYGGGVLGDENDVLRKIRIGQLHAAGFTGVGMGQIAPEVRILDTPFLFQNYQEVDDIYQKFNERFAKSFAANDYELLGWAEVGFVYVFTKAPVNNLEDMRKIKMWVWQGDPVAEATFKAFGLNPIPLSVIDVMTALQTNMVDGVYTSPLAAVALQWFTKVNYMMAIPLADAAGAVLISKKLYNQIPEPQQEILKSLAQKYLSKLTRLSREDNANAITTLKKNGIQVIPLPNQETLQSYYQVGAAARRQLIGKFYSPELLTEVESELQELRSQNNKR